MVTLVFVSVLLAAVSLDFFLIRPWEARRRSKPKVDADAALEFAVPRAVFFHPGHVWLRLNDNGLVTVGVDDFARTVIGDLSKVELPRVGERVIAGQPALVFLCGERRLRLVAPLSGRVTDSNIELGRDPVRLRWRPYKEGWMYRIEPDEGATRELASLMIGKDAALWMGDEIERLRRLFDEGQLIAPVEGALARSTDEAWSSFECEFLRSSGEPAGVPA